LQYLTVSSKIKNIKHDNERTVNSKLIQYAQQLIKHV